MADKAAAATSVASIGEASPACWAATWATGATSWLMRVMRCRTWRRRRHRPAGIRMTDESEPARLRAFWRARVRPTETDLIDRPVSSEISP